MKRIFSVGLIYFAVVFLTGFLLALIRIPFLLPRFGERVSELIEAPFMFVAIIITARSLVRRFDLAGDYPASLLSGLVAASLLLLVEFTVVLWLRGMSLSEFFAQRDPVAGAVYYTMVAFFAVAPLIFAVRDSSQK